MVVVNTSLEKNYRPGLYVVEAAHEVVSRVEDEGPLFNNSSQRIHKGLLVRSLAICFRDLMTAKHTLQQAFPNK